MQRFIDCYILFWASYTSWTNWLSICWFFKKIILAILIPPINGIIEGIDTLADEVWVLGSQFCGIEASNNTNEGEVASNVVTPMVLAQTPAKDVVKLSLSLW